MSRIIAIFELTGFTQQDYDKIMDKNSHAVISTQKDRPSHTSFQKGEAWCVIDVWESQEALMEFGQNHLLPIFAELGLTPPQPQIYPVHNFIGLIP